MPLSNTDFSSSAATVTPFGLSDPNDIWVLGFTRQLVGHEARLNREFDPETNEECVVVSVSATGTVEEIVAANDRWHRGLLEAIGEQAGRYRLSVDAQ